MDNERFKKILNVLLTIDDIDVIKYTIESLVEEIQVEIDNEKENDTKI
jgi:hypothetical protein